MKSPPAEVIASWPEPNYVNPQTRGRPELLIVGGIFLSLSLITFSLRLYTRLRISKNFGADDIVLIIGVVCNHYRQIDCQYLPGHLLLHNADVLYLDLLSRLGIVRSSL